MKFGATLLTASLAAAPFANAIAVTKNDVPQIEHIARDSSEEHDLWKRKGGGGGGGRGGGGGGTSSGGSRGGGSSGGGASSAPRGGVNGGRTVSGSGPQPRFGPGGGFYGGGARAPYKSGGVSPLGLAPIALVGFAAIAFWPGSWYGSSINGYRYNNEYSFFNESANEQQSKPILCACAEEAPCSCDEPEDRSERNAILDELIGNGSYAALNKSIVDVGNYNGRSTILINGTLPFDTTLADADADSAAAGMQAMLESMGWAPLVAAAIAAGLIM